MTTTEQTATAAPEITCARDYIVYLCSTPNGAPLLLPGSIPFRRNKGTVPAPVDINSDQFKLVGDMVMRADAVHTICPSSTHDPRYQLGPADSVEKMFSAAPPGHYHAEPSAWAAAAIQARG